MSGAYVKLSYSKWTFRPPELPLANQFYTYKKHIEQSNKNTIRPKTIIPFAIEVGIYAAVILAVVLIIWVLWLFSQKNAVSWLESNTPFFLKNMLVTGLGCFTSGSSI